MNLPILIIEDCDAIFFIVSRAFKKAGVTNPIYRCETGDEAMDYLFRKGKFSDPVISPRPAIILLDLGLPGINGRDILKAIKTNDILKIIPVIVLTGSNKEDDIIGCYRDGANSYIIKQNTEEKMVEMIKLISMYWLSTVYLPYQLESFS